jgi:hypothetical protein
MIPRKIAEPLAYNPHNVSIPLSTLPGNLHRQCSSRLRLQNVSTPMFCELTVASYAVLSFPEPHIVILSLTAPPMNQVFPPFPNPNILLLDVKCVTLKSPLS